MNKNIKNIIREKIIKTNLLKTELVVKIKKSIIQNNNTPNKYKLYCNFLLLKKQGKNCFLSKQHKICIFSGKRSGILKGFSFSRYKVKNLILRNKMTNIKKNNW